MQVRRALSKNQRAVLVVLALLRRPGPNKCYVKINDDRATYKERVRATYKCAEGPPGSKWNLAAADTPPLKRARRRAYKRAREELAMLEREAQPKQKPVKTL